MGGLVVGNGVGQPSVDGEDDGKGDGAVDEDRSTRHPVGERDGGQGTDGAENLVQDLVAELLGGGRDTDESEDGGVEVAETVSRELAKDTHHESLGHAPAAVVGDHQRAVVPPGLGLVGHGMADALADLVDLEADQAGAGVAVTVVVDEELHGLFLLALGHEVAGRLGNEVHGG